MTSTAAHATAKSAPAGLDASLLTIQQTSSPGTVPAPDSPEVKTSSCCTDHMITVRWTASNGWETPELRPYGPLSLMPTASVLHYATECFEGLKAYRGYDGKLRLFRPNRNCERMINSATRISLPTFNTVELEKLIMKLVSVDGPKWLPASRPGEFLYIRPTLIGTAAAVGVQTPSEALLYVICVLMPKMHNPVAHMPTDPLTPPATPANRTGLKLLASSADTIRAWPGGFGNAKVGANYGPSLLPHGAAKSRGFDQILWLFGEDGVVTEAGASNFFAVWRAKDQANKIEVVTAPLTDGIILPGVTRASVCDIAKQTKWSGMHGIEAVEVVERKFTMQDLCDADAEGRLLEAFCSGTAYFIASVSEIHYRGKDIVLPLGKGEGTLVADTIKHRLEGIMYGTEQHPWGIVLEEGPVLA